MLPVLILLQVDLQSYAHAIDSIRKVHGARSIPVLSGRTPDRRDIASMRVFTFRGISGKSPSAVLSNIEGPIVEDYDAIYLYEGKNALHIALVKLKRKERTRINLEQAERELLDALNRYRTTRGLQPLGWSRRLHTLALQHSRDMAGRGKLDHRGFGKRFERSGFSRCVENVALTPVEQTGTAIDLWKESREHRKNMLDRRITHGAIAIDTAQSMAYITFFACGN